MRYSLEPKYRKYAKAYVCHLQKHLEITMVKNMVRK